MTNLTRLRERVTLEKAVVTPRPGGEAVITWQPVADLFAAITTVAGRTVEVADGRQARVTHELVVRWRRGLDPDMRFVWNGAVLEIRAVLDRDGRRRWLTCYCEKRLP